MSGAEDQLDQGNALETRAGKEIPDATRSVHHCVVAHHHSSPAAVVKLRGELDDALKAVENLQAALRTSRRIGAAIGILMNRYGVDEGQAFDALKAASQMTQRKLRDIADDVVDTGDLRLTQRGTDIHARRARQRSQALPARPPCRARTPWG